MGEVANDIVNGACCAACGVIFQTDHGYPVLCTTCWDDASHDPKRKDYQRAIIPEGGA